jgi:hypothetical protein
MISSLSVEDDLLYSNECLARLDHVEARRGIPIPAPRGVETAYSELQCDRLSRTNHLGRF